MPQLWPCEGEAVSAQLLSDAAFAARRDAVLAAWRAACPADAAQLDAFLAPLARMESAADAANIAYLLCCAPAGCRAAFFCTLRRFRISALRCKGARFLASWFERIYLPRGGTPAQDVRGPYTTFFHECGHAVDYNLGRGPVHLADALPSAAYSYRFRWQGHNLQHWLRQDAAVHLMRSARMFAPAPAHAALLYRSLQRGGSEATLQSAQLSQDEVRALIDARHRLLAHYRNMICRGPANEAASDILGGVTDNVVTGASYNHGVGARWYTAARWYWYLPGGIETAAQSRELFAEYFSYLITKNSAALHSTRRHFPQAAAAMDALLAGLAEG